MSDNNLTLKEEFEAGQKLYNDIVNSTLSSNDESFQVILCKLKFIQFRASYS